MILTLEIDVLLVILARTTVLPEQKDKIMKGEGLHDISYWDFLFPSES